MTKISASELEHLAKMSGIILQKEEIPRLQNDLSNILNYVAQLSTINTNGVKPTYQVNNLANIWREDELTDEEVDLPKLLALAGNQVKNNQIKVPKVL